MEESDGSGKEVILLATKLEVSMKRSTQPTIHASVRESSFVDGLPTMHVSQQRSVSSCTSNCEGRGEVGLVLVDIDTLVRKEV